MEGKAVEACCERLGHNHLNYWKLNRDKEPAILLHCTARIVKLPSNYCNCPDQVRCLMSLLLKGTEERPLLIMFPVALLSQNTTICFLHHRFPQIIAATTIRV